MNFDLNMFGSFAQIIVLLVLIVGSCTLFTNAIEWTGHRFQLSEGAVGSVLAAVGTALPETLVPIIAIVSGLLGVSNMSADTGHNIGIGAILGAPFLLGTLAMFVSATALFIMASRQHRAASLNVDLHLFRRDFHYFFPAYIVVILAAFVPSLLVKQALALGLLVFYGLYVYRTIRKEHIPDEDFHLPALMFAPKRAATDPEPSTGLIIFQLTVSLIALLVMVHFFVGQINHVAEVMHIPALVLSLIITPIATEMPEKFNSVVWIRSGKDNLAMGNITGAMVFQSCIPTAIGLVGTPWILESSGFLSVGLCLASSLIIYVTAWKRPTLLPKAMMLSGVFYLTFVIFALMRMQG
jgi:cation:H+ antiporter